ncbi:synaptojanin-2-binding protein [Hoplias malabaricus]|uniref:synaptojanin-2-binding protein n=1 Tax=Hoplias malabaricus TaxID=27720 RepID=UPI003462EB95
MNGSTHRTAAALDIQLKRGPAGLGFNIVGGIDQQFLVDDSGIYVAKIKENGAAALDGRLQEGDKILEINGHKLQNLSHSAAVELFRTAGEDVHLRVQKRLPLTQNGPVISGPNGDSSSHIGPLAVCVVLSAVALAFFIYKRNTSFRRPF